MISIETLYLLPLALPVIGMAISFRRRKEEGGEEEPLAAYQLLVESTFDGVLALTTEGQIIWANQRFLDLMGYSAAEVENQPITSLVDPGDAEKVQQYLSQSLDQVQNLEAHAIDKKGSVHILHLVTTVYGKEDEPEIIVGVRDISEEDILQKRIIFLEKMNLLRRVMNSIGGDLGRIMDTLGPLADTGGDPKLTETLERLSDLEHRIDLFPRRGIKDVAEVTIPDLLKEAISSIKDAVPDLSREIHLEIADATFPVFGDADQLSEAIRNVLLNACQAAETTGGDVRVVCRSINVDRATPRRKFILPPGEYIHLAISDTGPGIPPETLDHIFDPLFSTRSGSPLSGLGLAVTYSIIKNHRGFVDMESTLGTGTTVDFFLPRSRIRRSIQEAPVDVTPAPAVKAEPVRAKAVEVVEAEVVETEPPVVIPVEIEEGVVVEAEVETEVEEVEEQAEKEAVVEVGEVAAPEAAAVVEEEELDEAEIASLSGHETILVIEEEPEVRSAILETLGHFGFNALPARNWVEGVDLFKRHAYLVDLILLNVIVPEMVWVKTLMDLRRVAPQARIGLMGSGEASTTMIRYLKMPGIFYLIKPLTTAGLMRGVRSSLDESVEEPIEETD